MNSPVVWSHTSQLSLENFQKLITVWGADNVVFWLFFSPLANAWGILEILFQKADNAPHSSVFAQATQHQYIHYRRHANDSKYATISSSVSSNGTLQTPPSLCVIAETV